MLPRLFLVISLSLASLVAQSTTQTTLQDPPTDASTALLFSFGLGDTEETAYDGSMSVEGGELVALAGYEMRAGDLIRDPRRWELSTRPAFPFSRRGHDEGILVDLPDGVMLQPRMYAYLNAVGATRVSVDTVAGDFSFSVREIPALGQRTYLDGKVSVERAPVAMLMGRTEERRYGQRWTDNDVPDVAVTSGGDVWTAWQGFRDGTDRVYAQRVGPNSAAPNKKVWAVSPEDGDVYRPAVGEDAEGKVWIVWSEQVDGNWDLYGRAFDGSAWGGTERITRGAQPDIHHVLERGPDGALHLTWQGFRNNRSSIFYANFVPDAGWSDPVRVSGAADGNAWEPSIAVSASGQVTIAWDEYGPNGYDVLLRQRQVDGDWLPSVPVAGTARAEFYASVAADQNGRVWIAWHEAEPHWGKDWGYPYDITGNGAGLYQERQIRLAVLDNGVLRQPIADVAAALPERGPGNNFSEYPELAVDGSGHVWMFFRYRRPAQHNLYSRTPSHHALWEIWAIAFDGREWSAPMLLPYSTGRNDMRVRTALGEEGELVVTYPTDRRSFRDFVNVLPDVFVSRTPLLGGTQTVRLRDFTLPPVTPGDPPHANDAADVVAIRNHAIDIGGNRLHPFRGDMHRHTEISWDGYNDGSTEDTYRYALDAADLDFLAITEHNFGIMDEYDWYRSQKLADVFRVGSFFVPLYGWERSVKFPNGHRNVVFPERGAKLLDVQHYEWATGEENNSAYTRQGPERFFGYLRKYNAIAMPHTSGTSMGTDWADYDPEVEPVVEIYQSDRNSYECEGCWRAAPADVTKEQFGGYKPEGMVSVAWEKGYRLGVQASSDHLGVHTAYSIILAESNERHALVNAIRARHTYGATDNIILDFRLIANGQEYIMGDEAAIAAAPVFRVFVQGTDNLADIELVKNGAVVMSQQPGQKTAEFEYRDNAELREEADYYYIRVRQSDRDQQVAWSSPIWVWQE